MECVRCSLLVFTILLMMASVSPKKKPKSVTTVLDAKWEVTPLVLEMSEYLADESETSFWSFVDLLSDQKDPIVLEKTDKSYYERALELIGNFLSQAQVSLLKFALSLHVYSPRVEMFCQIASQKRLMCPVAAYVNGNFECDLLQLQDAIREAAKVESSNTTAEVLKLDHKFPGSDSGPLVILYGELGSPEFSEFHKYLSDKAKRGQIQYVLRHWVKERQQRKVRLSGYGVELQLKSTEYKAQDDTKVEGGGTDDSEDEEEEEVEGLNFSKLKTLYVNKAPELEKLRIELIESSSELAPLKVWQFQELSLQAAQRIMAAPKEEVLHVLTYIAQNFPTQARSLVKTVVSQDMKNEMRQNQDRFATTLHLQPSDTALFVNGMYFDLETQDIFTILEYTRDELRIMEGLNDIVGKLWVRQCCFHSDDVLSSLKRSHPDLFTFDPGVTDKKASKALLALDLSSTGVDFGLDIRDSAVTWVNDIELDKQYNRWSSSLMDLLRPTFPGMIRSVRKNLYNLVICADPSTKDAIPLIKLVQSFLIHNAPLRLGIVFAVNGKKTGLEDSGVAILNAYNYVVEVSDDAEALNFVTDVYAKANNAEVTPSMVHSLLKSRYPGTDKDEIFGADSDYKTGMKLAVDFIEKSGLRHMPQVLMNGVPLPEKSLTPEDFEEAVLSEIMNQTPVLQKAVYKNELKDTDNVIDYLMNRPNIMPRLNDRILSASQSKYLSLTRFSSPSIRKLMDGNLRYVSTKSKNINLISNWVVTDLDSPIGRNLYLDALTHMSGSAGVRTALVVNSKSQDINENRVNRAVLCALFESDGAEDGLINKIKNILENGPAVSTGAMSLEELKLPASCKDSKSLDEIIAAHEKFVSDGLSFERGTRGIVSNGRLIGPFDEDEVFTLDDFDLLERYSLTTYVDKIHQALTKNSEDPDSISSDIIMKSVSLLSSRPESKGRFEITPHGEKHTVVKLPASQNGPALDLVAILDPVSNGAHKAGTLLSVLQQVVNCDIKIFLNCVEKNSDMPLKSFYRYVLEPSIQFTPSGQMAPGPMAKFLNMPGTPLLTQNMLVPDNWMVESIASPHDLDNIKLDQVDSNVHSHFELEYLILEGHCFDSNMGSPPRGLQITLGTESNPNEFDTIVMANLGYFQLKANPGEWTLQLRYGRSAALYDITGYSHLGTDYAVNNASDSAIKILISSFRSHTLKLKVTKKVDKMSVDLLGDDIEETQGLWGSITSTFGGQETGAEKDEVINIFSVASGHLYERFLRIMMLSVLKNTKSPVKFWFLKNYLSPTFKDFLPRMAKHYGFQYELVQYKWPRWLHQQTEKQRIIWGYKILFLDVLFPLDVKKIIFVDADQVVRADMKELVDLDLGGAPYGYTPFCDSRTEMDGFRFWTSGYWRNHLQGRKYHISALYVVDLKRFRRIAAGDRLRGQYQALSQDPNSLSNLDQDLPNNMIHQVAIRSLPQEWLWCETWCDDQSKKKAKTIDLCNNPQTKEAKLTAAMRIVPEWKDYDAEIKQFQLKLGATEDHEEEHEESSPIKTTHEAHSEL